MCSTDTISHDLGMQFRAIWGCGLLSDWNTTSSLTCVVEDNILECFANVRAEITVIQ